MAALSMLRGAGLQCSSANAGRCAAFDPASCFPGRGADGGADGL